MGYSNLSKFSLKYLSINIFSSKHMMSNCKKRINVCKNILMKMYLTLERNDHGK